MGLPSKLQVSSSLTRIACGSVSLVILSLMLFVATPPAMAQKELQKLEKGYRDWLERDVVYIISKQERQAFLALVTDDTRDRFITNFWELRNPTPGSPENAYKDET